MEIVLVMAALTVLLMVLAFLSLTRDDRELAQEYIALGSEEHSPNRRAGDSSAA
ncbi:hypothetical protein [Deinococcus sp. YIM 77859]|uniref:hypothetical protein n=1 Tax=Deinococcus sp. YIM 77859 TaxID=1540221 RepID=UPI0012E03CC9|nr:hypothetical protein [Deinococcus sp. YIM 77859]